VISERERELARRRMDDFARRRGDGVLDLACHAALPVVIDAELIHLLRLNFFADPGASLPFTAEADVLLSPLCADIGGGLYEMTPAVRAMLIERLGVRHGLERPREVALLLFRYDERRHPWAGRPRLERAQQLTALGFLDPQRAATWLERAKTEGGEFPVEGRAWFMAMRQELEQVAVAHASAEAAAPVFLDPPEPSLRWVLVIGTANADLSEVEQRACREVGRALARAGYGLITCDYPGVDYDVAKAFAKALNPDQSITDRLLHIVVPNHHTRFQSGTVLKVPDANNVMVQSVARSDAVVVIGGRGYTLRMSHMAKARGRPVFPLGYTGGMAQELYTAQTLHKDMPRTPDFAIPEGDLRALGDERTFRVERLLELIGGLLPRSLLLEIHAAAVDAELDRRLLLGGLGRAFVRSLADAPNPANQMLSDLSRLNCAERLRDQRMPLQVWLETAVSLAHGRPEADVFRRALNALLTRTKDLKPRAQRYRT
jgi:hypothetical protein